MGIFDATDIFTKYTARIRFRDRVLGGIPKKADMIEGWLRSKAGIDDTLEVTQAMVRTLYELGVDVPNDAPFEDVIEASKQLAGKAAVGFKQDEAGLYIEDRQIKAALKETVNILFGGERWKRPAQEKGQGKGPKNFVAERLFVNPQRIHLGVSEPSGVELIIGHVIGPEGPRSTLTYHEFVEQAEIEFEVLSTEDCIAAERWPRMWLHMQENGLGAVRSQSFGRFDVLAWDRVS